MVVGVALARSDHRLEGGLFVAVQLHPGVRIFPPSIDSSSGWVAEQILERRRFNLVPDAAATLVAAAGGMEFGQLSQRMEALSESRRDWGALIKSLLSIGLLADSDEVQADIRVGWMQKVRASWSQRGWHEAAEYHIMTFDYPCIDYTDLHFAVEQDRARMRKYAEIESDTERSKNDYVSRPGIALSMPMAEMANVPAHQFWDESQSDLHGRLTKEVLLVVLSLAFGPTSYIKPRPEAAEYFQRSSPSGGGRQPTEAYVFVRDIVGLETGWHHVTMSPFSLRYLGMPDGAETESARWFADSYQRFPFPARATIVLTSVFDRNMYRYREPRTFRTVHMDAGHLASTVEMVSQAKSIRAGVFFSDNAEMIESALGLDGMVEGYMLSIALADGLQEGVPSGNDE